MGIAYRSSVFTQPPTSFANLFDLDYLGDNQLLMPRDDIDTMAVALLALGYHPMSNNQDEIKLAYSELTKQRPQVKEYRTTYDYILEHGSDNDINIALAWTGEVEGFAEETGQDDWVFIAPESGSIIWYDCLAAPTTQPLSDAARSFLTFMSDAQNAAQNSEEMWFHSSHAHIASLVSEELLNDESVYTSSATLDNSYNYIALSRDAIQIRTRVLATLLK
jgi:putative spermidine/putrescine transport system substrate-binding protein